ncbi:MAG: MarR family transcriptional regulator [Proteobacteria bacterium]|nr:MarR family transcriptional regulator [Pseudomonadota bacterium]
MRRRIEVRVGGADEALDRFEAAWNAIDAERELSPRRILALPDLPALLKALSPARLALLATLREAGPSSVYQLAKRLERDYKNVHTDVGQLLDLGLIKREADGWVAVPWDVVRAEFRLAG